MSVRMIVLMIMRMAQSTSQRHKQMAMWRLLAETSMGKRKHGQMTDAEILSHGYSFRHRVYTDGTVPMVDRVEGCLLSVTTSAR